MAWKWARKYPGLKPGHSTSSFSAHCPFTGDSSPGISPSFISFSSTLLFQRLLHYKKILLYCKMYLPKLWGCFPMVSGNTRVLWVKGPQQRNDPNMCAQPWERLLLAQELRGQKKLTASLKPLLSHMLWVRQPCVCLWTMCVIVSINNYDVVAGVKSHLLLNSW